MDKDIVIYIGAMVMPEGNAGAQRTVSICKSLIELGYKPVVIGLTNEQNASTDILKTRKQYRLIDYYEIKYPHTLQEWTHRMLEIEKFIQVMNFYGVERIHSVIAIDYEMVALFRLFRYCKNNKIYLIADSMEWYEKSTLPFPMNVAKDIDTYVRMHYLYKRIDNAICISHYLYDYHKKISPQKNAVVIPVTVDMRDEKWNQTEKCTGGTVRTLVYAGNPGDGFIKERLDWVIDAVLDTNLHGNDCALKVIGITQEWYIKQLESKGIPYSIEQMDKYVSFLGVKPHRECLKEIQMSDFFVIAREDRLVTRAGFPTKLSEGLACGIPVITTPSSDIERYLKGKPFAFISDGFTYAQFREMVEKAVKLQDETLEDLKNRAKQYTGLDYKTFTPVLERLLEKLV